ncbi:MAG: hypothetical protein SFV15_01460 [Polyangiaceae bacterium]|nr:hypothetical protein [Polyangiaceae bacterium]
MSAPLTACDNRLGEPPECAKGRQRVRELLREGKVQAAKAELQVAAGVCGEASAWDITRLSDLIGREEKQRQLEAEKRQQEALLDQKQPLRPFLRWARSVLAANKERIGKVSCAPRGATDFGFCTASVESPTSTPFKVRYLANNSNTFRLEWEIAVPVTCNDFGGYRPGPEKTTPTGDKLTLCELTDHPFTGITALIVSSTHPSRVVLFPDRYLEGDPEFRKLVGANP